MDQIRWRITMTMGLYGDGCGGGLISKHKDLDIT
jgi:hypothetical protein